MQTSWFNGTKNKLLTVSGNGYSKYSTRLITLIGQHSIHLSKVDRYDHGNYSCRALYIYSGKPTHVVGHVLLFVKGEFRRKQILLCMTDVSKVVIMYITTYEMKI